jgi:hypothetical protein
MKCKALAQEPLVKSDHLTLFISLNLSTRGLAALRLPAGFIRCSESPSSVYGRYTRYCPHSSLRRSTEHELRYRYRTRACAISVVSESRHSLEQQFDRTRIDQELCLVIQCSSKEPPTERVTQRSHPSPHDGMCHLRHSVNFHEILRLGGLVPGDRQYGHYGATPRNFRKADNTPTILSGAHSRTQKPLSSLPS